MIRVALLGDGLFTWDGGIDILASMASVMDYLQREEKKELKIYLVLPLEYKAMRAARIILSGGKRNDRKMLQKLIKAIENVCSDFEVIYYRKHIKKIYNDNGKSLEKTLKHIQADICFPVLREAYPKLNIPWIGYIADFQEKYFPDLFEEDTLKYREENNIWQTENSQYLFAASKAVENDVKEFYPNYRCKIFVQPFAPIAPERFIDTRQININKYQLPKRYFMVSNQFWEHKSHITAFQALVKLQEMGYHEVEIICTGATEDTRNSRYFQYLQSEISVLGVEDKVRFLGFIPKLEQIALMKQAVAVVQPTLFEGGAGGGAVHSAVALKVPVILSDIPINKEIEETERILFFQVQNADDLAKRMIYMIENPLPAAELDEVRAFRKENAEKLAAFYYEMICDTVSGYKPFR